MEVKLDKNLRHAVQTLLSQIVDVNNNVKKQRENTELDEKDRLATENFANYHLMVLSILLHDLKEYALEKFPDAKDIISWANSHYQHGLANKAFTPCKCEECKVEEEQLQQVMENDKKVLEA